MGKGHLIAALLGIFLLEICIADEENCKKDYLGKEYRGAISKTRSGFDCQRWDSQKPHRHKFAVKSYPDADLVGNYCRNPDGEPDGPWCYTTSSEKRWEYCDVPLCRPDTCKKTTLGKEYRGEITKTKSGLECQRWDSQTPHKHMTTSDNYINGGVFENFCRNPDGEPGGPWCYTTSREKRWEYCDVPVCPKDCSAKKCEFYGKCGMSDEGSPECFCSMACPLIFKPVCGSDGQDYANQCMLEYKSCSTRKLITVAKQGKCKGLAPGSIKSKPIVVQGKVKLEKTDNSSVTLPSKSCLIVTLREAIYCDDETEDCPDTTIASTVMRNPKPSQDTIPYKLLVNSQLRPNRYLIGALWNRDWCSKDADDKKWIKTGDFFNDVAHSLEIDQAKSISYSKDIDVREFVKQQEKAKGESYEVEDCSTKTCEFYGRCRISDEGSPECFCSMACPLIFKPVCGSDGQDYANQCMLEYESCSTQKLITVAKQGKCKEKAMKTKCQKENENAMPMPGAYIPQCEEDGSYKKVQCHGSTGYCWCADENGKQIKGTEVRFKQPQCKKDFSDEKRVVIEGNVKLSEENNTIPSNYSSSCLIIALRRAIYCKNETEDCPDTTVAKTVVRNPTPSDNAIPYKLVINSHLPPDRYLIGAVWNLDWCSEDTKGKRWIKYSDFFNDVEHSIVVDVETTRSYTKDINVRELVKPKEKPEVKSKDDCSTLQCGFYSKCIKNEEGSPECVCDIACSMNFKPVCGSDGKEYSNECFMEYESCSTNRLITVAKEGKCKEEKKSKKACEKDRQDILDAFLEVDGKKVPLLGRDVPECNEDGSYKEVQCHGSTGYCWCVDENGIKRKETEVKGQRPRCRDVISKALGEEPAALTIEGNVKLDIENDDVVSNSSSSCLVITMSDPLYCEDEVCPDGTLERTVVRNPTPKDKAIAYKLAVPSLLKPNRYLIAAVWNRNWCSEDTKDAKWIKYGDFFNYIEHSVEVHSETKRSYTKDINVRELVEQKKKTEDESTAKKTKCQKEVVDVMNLLPVINGKSVPLFGAFVPECEKDGSYKKIQCHGSTGYCWCADENGKQIKGTEVRFKQPQCKNAFSDEKRVVIEGKVKLSEENNTNASNYSSSCLIIALRRAIYCKDETEDCPDTTVAKTVVRNPAPSDNAIPYKLVINSHLTPDRYLIGAVWNLDWCSEDTKGKRWIKYGDFFNDVEHSIEVDVETTRSHTKDINVRELVKPKEKPEVKSKDDCSTLQCGFYAKCKKNEEGSPECVCDIACSMNFKPVCGSDGKEYGNECVMEYESCSTNRLITVAKEGKCKEEKKSKKACEKDRQDILDAFLEVDGKKVPLLGRDVPECNEDGSYKEVQCHGSTGYCWCVDENGIKRKETEVKGQRPRCRDVISKALGEEPAALTIEGNVKLDIENDDMVSNSSSSCLVITMSEAIYCEDETENCPDTTVASTVVRNPTPKDKAIAYKLAVHSQLKPNRYLIAAVWNRNWCSEDTKDAKWIKYGDFFNDIEHSVEVDLEKKRSYTKDINVRELVEQKKKTEDESTANCSSMKCEYYGKCEVNEGGFPECTCNIACTKIYKPVCGSDGKEYSNQCVMEYESCLSRNMITVVKQGKCGEETKKTKCQKEVEEVMNSFPVIDGKRVRLLGAFVPECEKDGSYKKIQCHGSTGYCWCADENGEKIKGTIARQQPDC